jgi:beta-lactam-binding protein with PASTA domain
MQIAYQHANDTVPAPSAAMPGVPAELDDLVAWATARDPRDRPRDAREMLDHMAGVQQRATGQYRTAVLRPENATAILPSGGSAGAAAFGDDDADASEHDTTVLDRRGTQETPSRPRTGGRNAPGPRRTGAVTASLSPAGQRLADKSAKRRKRGWIALVVVVVLALVGAGIAAWYGPGPGGNVRIPAVAGKTVSQVRQALASNGLRAAQATVSRPDLEVAAGLVTATQPPADREVQKGTAIRIVVSSGPRMISLPAIVGQSASTAQAALDDDFDLQDPRYQFSADVPADTVIAATGRDSSGSVDLTTVEQYPERGPVTLTISLGAVPDVAGKSVADATTTLQAVGLELGSQTQQFSDSVPDGQVISSTVTDDPAVKGTAVDVVVSKGPVPITLPAVKGKTIDEAASTLQALGLRVSYPDCTNILCGFYDWKSKLPVRSTDPAAGTTVHKGDTVTLAYDQ